MEKDNSPNCTVVTEHKELGIEFRIVYPTKKIKEKTESSNFKLKIFREFVLSSLSSLLKSKKVSETGKQENPGIVRQTSALDANPDSGAAGLQWKKHFGDKLNVLLSEPLEDKLINSNAELNAITTSRFTLDSHRVAGDPRPHQGDSEVMTCAAEAKVVLMMEAFQFIFVRSLRQCVNYFDPACHSITHGGMLCFTVADTAVFVRSPHVVKRWYAADVIKTEYSKEMAARIILGALAKAAGRFNKALEPQYVLAVEDTFLVCVKVMRGNAASEASVNQVGRLLHCRFCEEKVFLPTQLAPLDDPYSLLPCPCKSNNLGKTAVLLGPMWMGSLFCLPFLDLMEQEGKSLGLSIKFSTLLSSLLCEAACDGTPKPVIVYKKNGELTKTTLIEDGTQKNVLPVLEHSKDEESAEDSIPTDKNNQNVGKRKCDLDPLERDSKIKKKKTDEEKNKEERQSKNIPFYHHVNKLKKVKVPGLDKLVSLVQKQGFSASRTHFDAQAIRTDANVAQFLSILEEKTAINM